MRIIMKSISNFTLLLLVVTFTACGGGGGGGNNNAAPPTVPSAPTSVVATAGDGKNTISWGTVTGATSYNIYWATTTGVTKANGTKITGAASPYTHNGLTNGTTYYYVVTAVNSVGESSESSQMSATPFSPPAKVAKTGQSTSYAAADDGALQKGVAWPNPRFTDNNDGTVTDNLTGLIWLKNANCYGPITWADAITKASNLASGMCGLSDGSTAGQWRLPSITELESLVDLKNYDRPLPSGHPFTNVANHLFYWSSTTYAPDTSYVWLLDSYNGNITRDSVWGPKTNNNSVCLWPVRDGSFTGSVALRKTGQTTSYATGDDGDLEKGVAWPNPRFTDNGNGTVTDNLTGLIWLKNANCFGSKSWTEAITAANSLASGACGLTDGSTAGQWRLPNRKELLSLVNYGQANQATWLGTQLFTAVQPSNYWSSSTYAWTDNSNNTISAWQVEFFHGATTTGNKPGVSEVIPGSGYVLAVRGGE